MTDKYTICDGCPCMNSDYDYGVKCNLEYDLTLMKVNDKWMHISKNCLLYEVVCKDSSYQPVRIEEVDE